MPSRTWSALILRHESLRSTRCAMRRFRPAFEHLEDRTTPATLFVTNTDDSGDGSLRDRIADAASGDTIGFMTAGTITLGSSLSIAKDLTIQGPGAGLVTVSGNSSVTVFSIAAGFDVTFAGLTIRDGKATGASGGGGIFALLDSTVIVNDCTFLNNSATLASGGAIAGQSNVILTVTNSTFSRNSVNLTDAGGGAIANSGILFVSNSSFADNSAWVGGAISFNGSALVSDAVFTENSASGFGGALHSNISGSTLSVTRSTFVGNTAGGQGGAFYNLYGSAAITNSTFTDNSATGGGAIENDSGGGTLMVRSSTFSRNTAITNGGAIESGGDGSTLTVTNSTFAANTAGGQGGGLASGGTLAVSHSTFTGNSGATGGGINNTGVGTATMYNTIAAGNTATTSGPDVFNATTGTTFTSLGDNLYGFSFNVTWQPSDIQTANPLLGALQNNGGPTQTIALLPGSPALAAGNTAGAPATDQRGFARVTDGQIDIGAWENQSQQLTLLPSSGGSGTAGFPRSFNLGSFTDSGSSGNYWQVNVNWGDGSPDTSFFTTRQGTLPSQSHTYATAGNYTITLTLNDANNNFEQATIPVTISTPHLLFDVQPTNTGAGQVINNPGGVVVWVVDALDNLINANIAVTVTAMGPGSFTGTSTTTVHAVNGVATFDDLTIHLVGSYTIGASAAGADPATSAGFAITPAAADRLVITAAPSGNVNANSSFTVTAEARDPFGNLDTNFGGSVTVAIDNDANPVSTLSGTPNPKNAGAGVVSFTNLQINHVGVGFTLDVTSGLLTPDTTAAFNIVAPAPVVTNVSSTATDGLKGVGALIPITVTFDRNVTVAGGTPTLALNSGAGVSAVYASGSGSNVLTFNYTVAAGQWTPGVTDLDYTSSAALVLPGSTTIRDSSTTQNANLTLPAPGAAGSLAANKNIRVDTRVSTVGAFDAGTATWYLRNSNSSGAPDAGQFQYGGPGWIPVVGDWNGDGKSTVGVFDPNTATWYLRNSNSSGGADAGQFQFGGAGWLPVVGDWDGNGTTTIGVVDPSTGMWYLKNSNSSGGANIGPFAYGAPGWRPVTGDWNGDGVTTIGVVDPSNTWYLRNSNNSGGADAGQFAYGAPGWRPVTGDWNGNGSTTIGAVDPGNTWYLRNSNNSGGPDAGQFGYGAPGWSPVAGDWNFPAAPLLAASPGSGAADATAAELQSTVAAARTLLGQAGLDAGTLARLGATQFELGNLPSGYLGLAFLAGNRVVIDADAAGHGWFVDATPYLSEEFADGVALPGSAALGRMDLLSAVLHELGHQAGLEHGDDLMAAVLAAGTRPADALDAFFTR